MDVLAILCLTVNRQTAYIEREIAGNTRSRIQLLNLLRDEILMKNGPPWDNAAVTFFYAEPALITSP